jgi:N-acyl-D-amino-acid deacylase
VHDTIIRGGKVVDGTGADPFSADVAIKDGRIAEIGKIASPARGEIDADGALVTPGFVDIHTHYDGQFLWDDVMEPSFSNGVTTAIAGNCGVGFAPVEKPYREALVDLMDGVEDIPGIVLNEGLDWNWTSFPDYLDRLGERNYTMDVASHLPQAPLRVFVMGGRALSHEQATADDLEQMSRLVKEALAAGAIGFSGSRILEHMSRSGEHVPGTFAAEEELLTVARAMRGSGHGVFQMAPLGAGGDTMGTQPSRDERVVEHQRMERLAEACGRPFTYIVHSCNHEPDEWRMLVEASAKANQRGLQIVPQIAARGLGFLFGLDAFHIFVLKPSYREIAHLPRAERAAAMRDPVRRRAILSEENDIEGYPQADRLLTMVERFGTMLERFYVLDEKVDYEPDESARLDRLAARTGRTMEEVFYDTLAAGDGRNTVVNFLMNYTHGNLDSVYEMLADPNTVSGLGDGGAHLAVICDAAMTTFHLSFWSRDRTRGPRLPIEKTVHKITGKPAELYGLSDRGIIAPGKRADLNVIDFDRIAIGMPEMHFDLPLGSPRLLQQGKGYLATLVNGVATRRGDADTGERPGRLVRAGQ